jgi:hypothetical protein
VASDPVSVDLGDFSELRMADVAINMLGAAVPHEETKRQAPQTLRPISLEDDMK